jgi:type IV pilus biogenesis protein CpaD/CtpE
MPAKKAAPKSANVGKWTVAPAAKRDNAHAVCLGAAVKHSLAGQISQPAGCLATKRALLQPIEVAS